MKKLKRIISTLTATVLAGSIMTSNVSALDNHLNIEVYMDGSFKAKNGVPTAWDTRLGTITSGVKTMYYQRFGIDLDFRFTLDSEHNITTSIDTCVGAANYENTCNHSDIPQCTSMTVLHHNSVYDIFENSSVMGTTDEVAMILTAHELCANTVNPHFDVLGAASSENKRLIVTEGDYIDSTTGRLVQQTRATIAHEIGHFYCVDDHYDTQYGDERDDCMWGFNNGTLKISNGMLMCDSCAAMIEQCKDIHNNT